MAAMRAASERGAAAVGTVSPSSAAIAVEHRPAPVRRCRSPAAVRQADRRPAAAPASCVASSFDSSTATSAGVDRASADDGAREAVDLGHDRPRADIDVAEDDAWARRSAASASPSSRCSLCLRLLFELEQALRQRDERPGEVAAIDRRDVPRMQRRPRRRCCTSSESDRDSARALPASSGSHRAAAASRRSSDNQDRARPWSTACPCRCWSATCVAPRA